MEEKNFGSYQEEENMNISEETEETTAKATDDEEVDFDTDAEYADDLFDDYDADSDFAGVDENTAVLLDKLEELWHAGVLTEDEYLEKVNLLLNGSKSVDYENLTLKVIAGAALVSTAVLATALVITTRNAKKQESRADAIIRRLSGAKDDFADAAQRFGKRFFG